MKDSSRDRQVITPLESETMEIDNSFKQSTTEWISPENTSKKKRLGWNDKMQATPTE